MADSVEEANKILASKWARAYADTKSSMLKAGQKVAGAVSKD